MEIIANLSFNPNTNPQKISNNYISECVGITLNTIPSLSSPIILIPENSRLVVNCFAESFVIHSVIGVKSICIGPKCQSELIV